MPDLTGKQPFYEMSISYEFKLYANLCICFCFMFVGGKKKSQKASSLLGFVLLVKISCKNIHIQLKLRNF